MDHHPSLDPLLAILLSAVDWYVILPFRDGVTGLPACRINAVPLSDRRRYTKLWIAHRLLCELSIAISLGVAGILLVHHYARSLGPIITVAGVRDSGYRRGPHHLGSLG